MDRTSIGNPNNILQNNQIASTCIKILKNHQQGVKCLLKLHNNNIASGSYDSTIKIWHNDTYECITTLSGHTQAVMCLIQLSNNDLCSAAGDLIKIWNTTLFECKNTLIGHTNTIYTLIQINNTTIASGGVDRCIKLWDVTTYRYKAKLTENNEWVRALITFGNAYIISGSDVFIHIWKIEALAYQRKLVSHLKPVSGLIEINTGTLASCSFDCNIIIWDILSYNVKAQINNLDSSITSISLLNQDYLISGDDDNTIRIFDMNTKKCVETINQHSKTITSIINIMRNNEHTIIASSSLDGTIAIWSIICA